MFRLSTFLAFVALGLAAAPTAASAAFAGGLLRSLPTAEEATSPSYSRDKFPHWTTTGGCTTREHVLHRYNAARNGRDCRSRTGRWRSAYDGAVTTDPSSFDIDHVVALAEAWRSGAGTRWDADTRKRFANDFAYRPSLIAVSATSNRSKGDRDPSEWTPPLASFGCKYAVNWIVVKYRWNLAVDPDERAALAKQLQGCPRAVVVVATPPRARITNAVRRPSSDGNGSNNDGGSAGAVFLMQPDIPGDQDCSDFDGPVRVLPGDPDGLDRDGDGIGCDSN